MSRHIWPPHFELGWQPMLKTGDSLGILGRALVATGNPATGGDLRWGGGLGGTSILVVTLVGCSPELALHDGAMEAEGLADVRPKRRWRKGVDQPGR
jgi:hypothetical protein